MAGSTTTRRERTFDHIAGLGWSIAVWTGIAVLIALHRYVTGWLGRPGEFLPALLDNLHYVLVWALATPLIIRSVDRFPIAGDGWLGNILRHTAFGTTFILFMNVAGETWNQAVGPATINAGTIFRGGVRNFMVFFPFAMSIYTAVVGAGHLIRIRSRSGRTRAPANATAETNSTGGRSPRRLQITEQYRTHLIDAGDITHIEADGHHVVIHTKERSYRPRMSFSDVLGRVSESEIIRIHRSHAVRASAVAEVQTYLYGDCMVILNDGTRLRMSRTYRDAAEAGLGLGDD